MGKNEEALAAAKVYFNLARLDKTADALDAILQCLKAARANDPELIERFKREQIEGALLTRQPNLYDPQHSFLASIKVPQAEMEEALAYVKSHPPGASGDFDYLLGVGNMLLIADHSAEARQLFEMTYNGTVRDGSLHDAMESIARAIKAEDGIIGRANQWLLENRPR
jgi:hypothetical protein